MSRVLIKAVHFLPIGKLDLFSWLAEQGRGAESHGRPQTPSATVELINAECVCTWQLGALLIKALITVDFRSCDIYNHGYFLQLKLVTFDSHFSVCVCVRGVLALTWWLIKRLVNARQKPFKTFKENSFPKKHRPGGSNNIVLTLRAQSWTEATIYLDQAGPYCIGGGSY